MALNADNNREWDKEKAENEQLRQRDKEKLLTLKREADRLKELVDDLQDNNRFLTEQLEHKTNQILLARELCFAMSETRLFQLVHFFSRLKRQFFHEGKAGRKEFLKWISARIHHKPDQNHNYNPLFSVIKLLNGEDLLEEELQSSEFLRNVYEREAVLKKTISAPKTGMAKRIEKLIGTQKYKGILIYPHVVFWEPLQTPQQILRAFAKEGWLCFFCEKDTINAGREAEKNLWIVHEGDLVQALHRMPDVSVTVLLTWMASISFVNALPNKKIWYHLLDHLDIFSYYDAQYLKAHNEMVERADWVSYVAHPLMEFLKGRKDAIYLPNGCVPEEFLHIHLDFVPPEMQKIVKTGHKIIGYYGYLAEWMDYDMVRKAALSRPEYEFVFIGEAIYDVSKISDLPNVHLLGKKPYRELSDYAKLFDVATIPFVINEKMDCVSPIKFYEYCALGLPTVASVMPEIKAHACDFITCVDGTEEYLAALDRFVSPEVKEKAKRAGMTLAKENTWKSRAKTMEKAFLQAKSALLKEPYQKYDVIFLSVIDYDFRYQRPQHFADRFAASGHRVFYINANHYQETSVQKQKENLYVVNFKNERDSAIHVTDWSADPEALKRYFDDLLKRFCISDALTIVDYPNWIHGACYLREHYGFRFVTDYMDDFTGFLNPANELVKKNCLELLEKSDAVIASSQFLYDIAQKYNSNVTIVRNGSEYEHFHKAFGVSPKKERKIVGYYGAIAEWFDVEKVCYAASHLPECDFVLIGNVSAGRETLSQCKNIRLVGELPYDKLPERLLDFDVCLIPFDTHTDLIKATNPVKFYEYLCAGKKIVATEIPELFPYRDRYVYLANDNEQFLTDIKLCLNGNDTLASSEECAAFGKENDWQVRYDAFQEACVSNVPKVSVIVLTYNNLVLNRLCVKSVLTKTAYPRYELVIVDNDSTDGTAEWLKELDKEKNPRIKVILNDENKGFAGGNNVALRQADGDYALLLNNDTIVTRGWLTALVKHMENHPRLGMCGSVTNSIGNEAKIKADYGSMEEIDGFAERYTRQHMGQEWKNPRLLALFCTIIRREAILKCGLLDESYKVGMFEDDDYAEAVQKEGYSICVAEDSFVHHFEGATFKKIDRKRYQEIFNANCAFFEKKWNKKWHAPIFRPGVQWDTNLDATKWILEEAFSEDDEKDRPKTAEPTKTAEPKMIPLVLPQKGLFKPQPDTSLKVELARQNARFTQAQLALQHLELSAPLARTRKTGPRIYLLAGVPYYDIGGGQRSAQLAKVFDRMGYRVFYLHAAPSSDSDWELQLPAVRHDFVGQTTPEDFLKDLSPGDICITEISCTAFLPYWESARQKGAKLVYEQIDNWETSLGDTLYDRNALSQMIGEADVLTATNRVLCKQLQKQTTKEVFYLPNAADTMLFEPEFSYDCPPDLVQGKKTLLYFGSLYGEWINWDLVRDAAVLTPGYEWNFIGNAQCIKEIQTTMPSNIHFLGKKRQSELPAYLSYSDFAILPFLDGAIGDCVSPIKVFEYLSMKTRVLASGLPEIKEYPNVFYSSSAQEWEKFIRADEAAEDCRAFVEENSWDARCNALLDICGAELFPKKKVFGKISIIILNYNNQNTIFRCIDSLLHYRGKYGYEIIVVDNGSTDGSWEGLSRYQGKITLLRNTKNGCSSGRNLGVQHAKGEYLFFLDSDQWGINSRFLDPALEVLRSPEIGAVAWAGGWLYSDEDGAFKTADALLGLGMTPDTLYRDDFSYLGSGGMLLKRSVFEETDGFDEAYDPTCFEDTDFSMQLLHLGYRLAYCPRIGIVHLPHQTTGVGGGKAYLNLYQRHQTYFMKKWEAKDNTALKNVLH